MKYANGLYTLKNPEKYVGKIAPRYRSSWELAFMTFCDNHPSVLRWASESIRIPYKNPLTGKDTNYVPDFFLQYKDAQGNERAEIVEIKPTKETSLESAGKSTYNRAMVAINHSKWAAAKAWCANHNINFRIVTEQDMFAGTVKRKR